MLRSPYSFSMQTLSIICSWDLFGSTFLVIFSMSCISKVMHAEESFSWTLWWKFTGVVQNYTLFRKARIKELSLLFKVYNKSIFIKKWRNFLKMFWIKTNIFKKISSSWKDWNIAFFIFKIMFVRGIFFQWLSFSADCISMFTHVYRFHQMQYIHGK